MELVKKVRQVMKLLINADKNMTTSRYKDVLNEIAFHFSFESLAFGSSRKSGLFTIQYLVSPKPDSGNTAPSVQYDQIISTFDREKAKAFKDAGLIILSCTYEQGDIVTDPVSGSVSLAFTINIHVAEKSK